MFYQMFTAGINLPLVLLYGDLKLRCNLGLFLWMGKLFSVDANDSYDRNDMAQILRRQQFSRLLA